MSALTFTLKTQPKQRVDMSPLVPVNLSGKTIAEIAQLTLQCGKLQIPVGELFEITGDDAQIIVINNSFEKLDFIGK